MTVFDAAPLPDAFLFDMDGLLLDTERLALAAFVEVTAPHGVDAVAAERFFLTLVGTSHAVTRERTQAFLPGVPFDTLDAGWTAAMARQMQGGVPLRPKVRPVLEALAARAARMAVVTSTRAARAAHHLEAAGLAHFFERVTGGDEVSANKPDPAPYLETATAMGVDPARCAAFEDSDRGITAAVRAGCRAVQIPDLRPPDPLPRLGQLVAVDLEEAMRVLGVFPADLALDAKAASGAG